MRDNLACTRLALESVLANTEEPPYEVVVVDNGSPEPTRTYLEVLATRNRHVRVIHNERNPGLAAGYKRGLAAAKGEILVLLADDVIVTPCWLRDLVQHLDDPAVGLVSPATNRSRGAEQVSSSYANYGELLQFAARQRRALVAGSWEGLVGPIADQLHGRVALRQLAEVPRRPVGGAVVDNDQLTRLLGGCQHALEAQPEQGEVVMRGDDHTHNG